MFPGWAASSAVTTSNPRPLQQEAGWACLPNLAGVRVYISSSLRARTRKFLFPHFPAVPGEGKSVVPGQVAPFGVRQAQVRILAGLHIGSVVLVQDTEAWGLQTDRGFSMGWVGPLLWSKQTGSKCK